MTANVDQELNIPLHPLPAAATVAIVAEGSWSDAALAALVDGFGCRATVVNLDVAESIRAAAIIVRSQRRLAQLARLGVPARSFLVGLGVQVGQAGGLAVRCISIPDGERSADHLEQALRRFAVGPVAEPVRLSRREREVVVTYTLGSTVRETSREHHIAESTVRSHFRRVMQRYGDAGRPVNNKSQLLIQLIADGWVDRRQLLG